MRWISIFVLFSIHEFLFPILCAKYKKCSILNVQSQASSLEMLTAISPSGSESCSCDPHQSLTLVPEETWIFSEAKRIYPSSVALQGCSCCPITSCYILDLLLWFGSEYKGIWLKLIHTIICEVWMERSMAKWDNQNPKMSPKTV